MDNLLKQYFTIQKLKDAFFTTDFLTLRKDDCAKMHFFVVDLMFLNIVISLHSTKKEVQGTAREDQDLVSS